MKKFLALALALVMALALAVPAMAFTSAVVEEEADVDYQLSVELVEFEGDFAGTSVFTAPAPADRGYAKNEIVAFVVSFIVPKGKDLGDYDKLVVSGENVTLIEAGTEHNSVVPAADGLTLDAATGELFDALTVANYDATDAAKAINPKWLAFARVAGDDASITAKLVDTAKAAAKFVDNKLAVATDDATYSIEKFVLADKTIDYTVKKDGKGIFEIKTDKDGVSKKLSVWDANAVKYGVALDNNNNYCFHTEAAGKDYGAGATGADKIAYDALVDIVEDEFAGVFGFDFALLGGVVNEKTFTDMIVNTDIEYTVEIAPWTAYVQVPDVIVVDPPKTGDATVLVGIVMAIVAAAGVVVFNKVRA